MLLKTGDKVRTRYGVGELHGKDSTGQHWLVKYPDEFEEHVVPDMIKPYVEPEPSADTEEIGAKKKK